MNAKWKCAADELLNVNGRRCTPQAEDRFHEPGQTSEVHVDDLLSSQTVDEHMYDLVDQK